MVTAISEETGQEILRELREMRALIDGLLTEFEPALALFRGTKSVSPNWVQAAGAYRAARKEARKGALNGGG